MPELATTYCVIGDPVGHSMSPKIHSFVYKTLALNLSYETVHVRRNALKSFVASCRKNGRPGFNVTIPHKEAVIPLLDSLSPLAERIGAVNTVKNDNGKLTGFNTDVEGCRRALAIHPFDPGGKIVLIGAGGAARATLEALAFLRPAQVTLSDIKLERAVNLQKYYQPLVSMPITTARTESRELETALRKTDIVINASPSGMWPRTDETPVSPEWIKPGAVLLDMVPKPIITRLLRESGNRGVKTIPGLHMLIAQALAAQEIWLNQSLPDDLFHRLREHLTESEAYHV